MNATIEITPALHGNVRVTIEMNGHAICETWKMSESEAEAEAEKVAESMGYRVAA